MQNERKEMHRGCYSAYLRFDTLRPRQNGRHFADDIFKCIFLNENVWIPIKFSLKFVPKVSINNIPALVQIRAWRRPGDKPLSEPMMVSLTTHICATRPQWVDVGQYKGRSWKRVKECSYSRQLLICFCVIRHKSVLLVVQRVNMHVYECVFQIKHALWDLSPTLQRPSR